MADKRPKMKAEPVVSTLQEFNDLVESMRVAWEFDPDDVCRPWFRGQQRKNWELIPSLVRIGRFDRETEDDIREEFATRAPALSRFEPLPVNDWDLYFLMQHYGAPTRLLDWTESPVIALYFAVRDNPGHYDSAVWMLDPYELNRRVARKNEVVSPSAQGVSKSDSRRVAPWLPERWSKAKLPEGPIAIFPTHIARRISSQKACFTVHGSALHGFRKFVRGRDACLKKVILPGRSVKNIRRSLEQIGIDDTTIFPDLEGLGRALSTSYRDSVDKAPHTDVFVRIKPSKLHRSGVGVFAIKRIPKGKQIFAGENEEVMWIRKTSIPKDGPIRRLYDDFAVIDGEFYGCPTSFNRLTPAWFLNESKRPNARSDENYVFFAIRDISVGEEITIDYSTFSDYPQ
ncbi:MAG TPA: FRG domain-containing protein [Terracidiphilus sp.]|nr:FRG domain-containing protein [Terracidiphilus sp.]